MRAYVATAHRFIDFLGRHRGEEIGRFGLLAMHAVDLRAFLAERRGEGLGASSAAREMSAVRAFLTFAAEEAGNVPQLPRTRAPKRPRTLPRPASPADAMALAEDAGAAAPSASTAARISWSVLTGGISAVKIRLSSDRPSPGKGTAR